MSDITSDEVAERKRKVSEDQAFKYAMLAARRTGTERVEIGVKKARGPMSTLRRFDAPATASMTGSYGAMCAES